MPRPLTNESILTLPADLLKHITDHLSPRDEKALKLTCKRMNLLIAQPPPALAAHHHPAFLAIQQRDFMLPPPRGAGDGRATPLPQSPMPWKQAATLHAIETENREVEDRERARGMDLSDTEDGYDEEDEGGDTLGHGLGSTLRRTRIKHKKSILSWTANLDSAPSSPVVTSPSVASFARSRDGSPGPAMPTFSVTTS